MSDWRFYFPEEGETAEDATAVPSEYTTIDADDAARYAAEHDWSDRDGWERGMNECFEITIIAPDGEETTFNAHHEPAVSHQVSEKI